MSLTLRAGLPHIYEERESIKVRSLSLSLLLPYPPLPMGLAPENCIFGASLGGGMTRATNIKSEKLNSVSPCTVDQSAYAYCIERRPLGCETGLEQHASEW